MKLKIEPEYIYLFIVFTALLFFGPGNLWSHTLQHPTPVGYHASDAFQHQTRAEAIKTIGNYVHEAPWIAAGFKDIIGFYPPGLYYLSIGLSYASGLEVFDTIYIISFFFSVFGALLMYFVVRKFNRSVAILSLPFSVLIFTGISMVGFTWGATTSLVAQVFIILTIWVALLLDEKYAWMALGIALSGAVLTHSSELVIAGGFVALYFLITLVSKFVLKQERMPRLRTMVFGSVLFVAISWFFILIAQLTWARFYPLDPFDVWTTHGGYPGIVNLSDYGLMLLIMGVGLLAGLYFLWKQRADMPVALLAGAYMIVVGYGNFFGLNYRAFQIRYFWPIYLGVFLGLGIFFVAQFVMKKIPQMYAIGVAMVLLVMFSGIVVIPAIPHYERLESQGIDAAHWDTFMWLRQNTPKDAILYFFFGDLYRSNAVLRNTERTHYQVLSHSNPTSTADFITKMQQGVVSETYDSALLGDCCGANYPYWKGFGDIGFRFLEMNKSAFYKPTNICQMDYYVFDKAASDPRLAQYNLVIAQSMMDTGHFQVVHDNQISVILKNNQPGESCIANATA